MTQESHYTEEQGAKVCEHIANGSSLRQIAKMEGMPSKTTILKWLAAFPAFATQYACARELQAEGMLEEIIERATRTDSFAENTF